MRPAAEVRQVPWAGALRQQCQGRLSDTEAGQLAMDFLTAGLADNTIGSYDGKLQKFLSFCAAHQYQALPTTQDTVVEYIGHLASTGTIGVDNIQPYLSCINTAHVQMGLEPPALGPAMRNLHGAQGLA